MNPESLSMLIADPQRVDVQSEVDNRDSLWYLCKWINFNCKRCKNKVGKIILSTPQNLSFLLNQCVIDSDSVNTINSIPIVNIRYQLSVFDKKYEELKNLEKIEESLFNDFEIYNSKFEEGLVDARHILETLEVPRHLIV